ncbi:MAG: hypothetical protein CFE45_01515, partial [Burkholderiales bacterium PBB5]
AGSDAGQVVHTDILLQRMHADDRATALQAVRQAVRDHTPLALELRHLLADGGVQWLSVYGLLHLDARGEPQRVVGTLQDITARKRAEAAVMASARRLSMALHASRMGVWEWTVEDSSVHYSPEVFELVGLPSPGPEGGQMPLDQMYECVHPEDRALLVRVVEHALANSGEFVVELRAVLANGEVRWLSDGGRVELGPDGRPLRVVGTLRDITEHRRIQQQLRDDALRRRVMIEQSRDGVVMLNTDGTVDDVNPAYAQLLGYEVAELREMHLWDWEPLSDAESTLRRLADAERGAVLYETVHRRKDASLINVEVSATRVELQGRALWFCVCRDVTQRRRAEQALRDSNELVVAVGDSLLDHMAVLDRHGVIHRTNAAWRSCADGETLTGGDTAVLLCGQPGDDYLEALKVAEAAGEGAVVRLVAEARRALEAVLGGQRASAEMEFPLPGVVALRWYRMSVTPLRTAQGGAVVLHADITRRKLTETALRESEARFRATFENSAVGIAEHDLNGGWISVNPRLCEITGYRRDELIKVDPVALTHADDLGLDRQMSRRVLSGELPSVTTELRYLRRDGSAVWVARTSSVVRDVLGRPQYVVSIIEDISERRRMQDRLHASEQQYRAMVDTLGEGVIVSDSGGHFLRCNPAAERLLGLTLAQMQASDTPWDMVDPDGAPVPRHELPLARTLASGQALRGTVLGWRLPGRSMVWLQVNCAPVDVRGPNPAGGPAEAGGAVLSFADITERKRIEAELAQHRHHLEEVVVARTLELQQAMRARVESEHFLRSVADNLPDMVAYWDGQRICRFANKAYRDWMGEPGVQVVGATREALIGPADQDDGEAAFAAAMGGRRQSFEYPLTHESGELRYSWIHYIPDRQV